MALKPRKHPRFFVFAHTYDDCGRMSSAKPLMPAVDRIRARIAGKPLKMVDASHVDLRVTEK